MEHNKVVTYSLLAHINNSGNLVKDLFDVFKPLVKRTLTKMCNEGITQGKSIAEIKTRVDEEYKLDIPIPVLKIILSRIAAEVNQEGVGKFQLYSDNAFAITDYVFVEFEELIKDKEDEIQKLEQLFADFCKINNVKLEEQSGIFEFIESNKTTIAKYLSFKGKRRKDDFTIEALFVDYFKNFKEVFDLIKNIYLGSIISSYIEYQTNPINLQIELLFDTNFIVSLLDLKTSESTHTCNKLVEIAKSLGYRLNVLNITIAETRNLLEKRAEHFDSAFLAKKIDPEDIYNACDRRKLNKTDLQRIADNLEDDLGKLGITVIPHSDKYQNLARFSDEFKKFKAIRNNDFAALHDATVLYYVRDKRGNKRIKDFDKVNCWFVNNSSAWQSSDSLISTKGENGHQPETIRAEDFINILWLSNPNIKKQVGEADLAEIGITRMISCTLNETLPKSAIIRELDDNIKKYAAEKISDKDIVRVATRIANRNLKDLEELNKIADTNSEDFVKRLQREADIEREEGEKRMKEFQELIHRLVKKEKQLDEVRDNYKNKLHEAKTTQSTAIKTVNESTAQLDEEKRKRLKAENELIKIKRDKYFKDKLNTWRRRNWIELIIGISAFVGGVLWMMFKSEWDMNKAMTLFVELNKNLVFSAILWLAGLIFSIVTLRSLVDKYRNHSNIKAFLDNLEKHDMPEEYKDKKE
ncbi:MAG: hypothetical protein JST63_16145 [Bacteroidetes bacterium]|nr:hypothetical protein [Bacteroidota bacterium]